MIILTHGVYRSGSTWLFNTVMEMLKCTETPYASLYADTFSDELATAINTVNFVVVKTHAPTFDLLNRLPDSEVVFVTTVRDPRDCVVSFRQQFGLPQNKAAQRVKNSCDAATFLKRRLSAKVYKYESGFTDTFETIDEVCRLLSLSLSRDKAFAVFQSLQPDAVREKLKILEQTDRFRNGDPAITHDTATHWHPRHIGDRQVNKYKTALSSESADWIYRMNYVFCEEFGYRNDIK